MTIKILESGEIKTLTMIDPATGVDGVVDFVYNNGGTANFVYYDETGQYETEQADFDWWSKVISDHSTLAARIFSSSDPETLRAVLDGSGCYNMDLEDQASAANSALDEVLRDGDEGGVLLYG